MNVADAVADEVCGALGVDTSKPNIARVYNVLLGGKDNFRADRAEARRLLAVYPWLDEKVRDNRRFLGRAVFWLAAGGVRQFLDLGAGLPAAGSTHEIARKASGDARVVYVDSDPVVVSHGRALLAGPGITVARADLTDPASVLAHEAVTAVLDLREPVAVILAMVLHFVPAGEAAQIVAAYTQALAPGSWLVISCGSGDEQTGGALAREYQPATLHNHGCDDIAGWFAPLDLLSPPGLVDAHRWEPGRPVPPPSQQGGHVLAGAGRVPDALEAGAARPRRQVAR